MIDRGHRFGIGSLLALMLALAFVGTVVLAVFSSVLCSERVARDELAQLALEDVARRVERGVNNLKSVREMSDYVALTRARALAQLIAENPSVLKPENRERFNSYAELLGVDELHVTDEKGILYRSLPAVYEGYNMASSAQSAAFMPAITNADFALVQEPQLKGIATGDQGRDRHIFQYAGVARRDRQGIVQIGYRAERVAEAMKLADIDEIAATTRVGRNGGVKIRPSYGSVAGSGFVRTVDAGGRPVALFQTTCEGYLITVSIPDDFSALADDGIRSFLVVLSVILLLLVVFSFPSVRLVIKEDFIALRHQLSVGIARRRSFLKSFLSPLALAAFVFSAIILSGIYLVVSRGTLNAAKDRLRAAAEDITIDLDDCVNGQLAFIGSEICREYGSPEAMQDVDLVAMMRTYFVDELNVVDATGRCIASTIPAIVGNDQWKKANPSKFNQALIVDGQMMFSQAFRGSATEAGVYRKYVGIAFPPPAKGYLQIGFDRRRLFNSIDYRIKEVAHSWHIGETGFFIISKTVNGEIVSTLDESIEGKTVAAVGLDVFAARMNENVEDRDPVSCGFRGFKDVRYFDSEINGVPCLCTSGIVNQFHRYTAAIPYPEVKRTAARVLVVTAIAILVAMIIVVSFMSKLADLVSSLRGFIAKDKEQREKDLTLAKTIQTSSLPVVFPDERDYKIFALMNTAREVGGDFYDFYTLPSGRILFLIADVSGKGVPAAMFMMRAKATIRAAVFGGAPDLASCLAEANDALAEKNDAEMFITAWIGVYDRRTGEIEYVNAGHNPPLVKHSDGSVEWLRARGGMALAAMGGVGFRASKTVLKPGDSIFLYTDGVTEAMNSSAAQYGEERLEKRLASAGADFVSEVIADVSTFVADAEQSDDITMLALDVKKQ